MIAIRFYILIVCLIPILVSCSKTNPGCKKIDHYEERKKIIGLSVLSPQEDSWYFKQVSPARIEFGSVKSNKRQSIVASVVAHRIPLAESDNDFLQKISEERWKEKKDSRYKDLLIEQNLSYELGTLCVKYHTKYEDHGSKYLSKKTAFFIVEDIGVICRHPENFGVGISVGISQRTEPNKSLPNFELIANDFLSSARFEKLPTE